MAPNQIMFVLFSAMIIVFSVLTVTTRKILRAAVFLLFVLVSTSGLYFLLNYQFLAAVQLTLYAGGIVVLIIFSILLTSHISQKFEPYGWQKTLFSAIAAISGAILSIITILDYNFSATTEAAQDVNMRLIGKSLLSTDNDGYVLPFEVISVLLLAAMIAAIVVAKKGAPGKIQTSSTNKE
jgi:NADH-quinone oxidoreductase subunit J